MRSGSHDDFSKSAVQMKEEEIDRVGSYSRPQETNVPGKKCYRCGRSNHLAHSCVHKDTVCHNCNKRGHLARVRQARGSQPPRKMLNTPRAQWLEQTSKADNPGEDVIFSVVSRATPSYQVVIEVNGQPITMLLVQRCRLYPRKPGRSGCLRYP